MDETNQKKKLLLTGIIVTSIIFVIVLILVIVLSAQDAKKTKIQFGDKLYKTKTINLNAGDGTYQQKTIEYGTNKETVPILVETPAGEIYYCIETISKLSNYRYNNGAYGDQVDESRDKCYIDNGGEYVTFVANSNKITKNIKTVENYEGELKVVNELRRKNDSVYETTDELEEESFKLEKPVIQIDGKLYASYDAISKGLNMTITQDGSTLQFQTLESLVNTYSGTLSSSNYTLTQNFRNKRALSSGYAVVGKGEEYGVIELTTGNEVISLKYDSVEYVQGIGEFIVSSKSKFGMIKPGNSTPTIKLEYENIALLDAEKELYMVQFNEKYGVVNAKGEEIIPTEYDQIGLNDVKAYRSQGITNKYIIADECIPVMRNNNYGLYNIKGQILASAHYLGLGCENPSKIIENTNAMPTLTVPLSDTITGIVFSTRTGSSTTYGLITTNGTVVLNGYYSAIYYRQQNGKTEYCFDKPSNNEFLTLKELLETRPTVREMINQTKSSKELAEETRREKQDIAHTENNDNKNNDEEDENNQEENNQEINNEED